MTKPFLLPEILVIENDPGAADEIREALAIARSSCLRIVQRGMRPSILLNSRVVTES